MNKYLKAGMSTVAALLMATLIAISITVIEKVDNAIGSPILGISFVVLLVIGIFLYYVKSHKEESDIDNIGKCCGED